MVKSPISDRKALQKNKIKILCFSASQNVFAQLQQTENGFAKVCAFDWTRKCSGNKFGLTISKSTTELCFVTAIWIALYLRFLGCTERTLQLVITLTFQIFSAFKQRSHCRVPYEFLT